MKRLIIAGAGFGGLRIASKLNNNKDYAVTLIDRFNYHQFQPLFYQVATAGLDASNISFPLRKVFHKSKNVRIRIAEIEQVIPSSNKIITSIGEMGYDQLVIATGAGTNFFGNKNIAENCFPMKSTVEALQIRHQLIQNFEDALQADDKKAFEKLMTIVVVGGGPTGVEVSGALADWRRYVLPKDYPELDFSQMNIYLLEGTDKTLAAMSERSSADSRKYLDQLGVIVKTNTLMKDYDGNTITLADGKTISSATVIWAAGIKGNIPSGVDPGLVARGNRIKVDRFCRLQGFENIFAIGDVAFMEEEKYPNGHPQVASVAIQQADLLVNNFKAVIKEKVLKQFSYKDRGSMATVGRNLAVVDMPKPRLHFGGFLAWLIWMGLHLMLILGVKNRFFVFCNWLYNYVTYDQNLRLIFKEFHRPKRV